MRSLPVPVYLELLLLMLHNHHQMPLHHIMAHHPTNSINALIDDVLI